MASLMVFVTLELALGAVDARHYHPVSSSSMSSPRTSGQRQGRYER